MSEPLHETTVCPNVIIGAINHLKSIVHQNAIDKGFYDNNASESEFIAAACSNLHGEVSELWEAHRKKELNEPCEKVFDMAVRNLPELTCLEEELADIIIRALDMAGKLNVDIGTAVLAKHQFNATREYRHGGKQA